MVETEKKNHYNRYGNIRIALSKIRQRNIDVNEKGDEPRHDFLLNKEIGKLQLDVFCAESLRRAFSGRICSEVCVENNVLCVHMSGRGGVTVTAKGDK